MLDAEELYETGRSFWPAHDRRMNKGIDYFERAVAPSLTTPWRTRSPPIAI